jgi:N6-L-threonylcarbamoyladenine synthase
VKILAIESSCDEFAAAVVEDGQRVLAEAVYSQIDLHKAFGGVVPEIAARSHVEVAIPVVEECLEQFRAASTALLSPSKLKPDFDVWDDIDAIAVTNRPGLSGSLLIGTLTARTLALLKNKPIYAVDHMEGHVYANWLNVDTDNQSFKRPQFPALALVVSGGHSQIMLFHSHSNYEIVGETQDDAAGEVFDKVAKILGLPYPGGPSIAKAAEHGNADKYQLPIPKCANPLDFSFSGLKTAVLRAVQAEVGVDHTFPSFELAARLNASSRDDFAASFQKTACLTLAKGMALAFAKYQPKSVLIAGGVAANTELRRLLALELSSVNDGKVSISQTNPIICPELKYCTDNAAMIGARAYFLSQYAKPDDPLAMEIGVN